MQQRRLIDTRKPVLTRSAASQRKRKLRMMSVALVAAVSATVVLRG